MGHDDPGQVAHLRGQGFPANEQLLALVLDVATAGDGIVPLQGIEDLSKDNLNDSSFAGSTMTWNCCGSPPQILTSTTPGTARRFMPMSHSERSQRHGAVAGAFERELIDFAQVRS